jgi:hypothetical protein
MQPSLLTVREASVALFGTDSRSNMNRVYAMINEDQLRVRRFGRRIFVPARSIEELTNADE